MRTFEASGFSLCFNFFSRHRVIAGLVGFKVAYFTAILLALAAWSDLDVQTFYNVDARWPRQGGPVFLSHFATWDAAHYLYLSELGYHRGTPSCAFYPLWPKLVSLCSLWSARSHLWVALLLSNLLSTCALVLFYRIVFSKWGKEVALWSLIFMVCFPGSLFFQFNYTESLFLLLTILLWSGLYTERYSVVLFASTALPLTRAVGIFVVLPIAYFALRPTLSWITNCKRSEAGFQCSHEFPWTDTRKRALLLVGPPVGWACYFVLMKLWTGNAFEGFVAQKHWHVHSVWNLIDLPKFVYGLVTPSEWHEFSGSLLDRLVFLLVVYAVPTIWKLDVDLFLWTFILAVLPAMSGTFTSFTRFCSCAFPVFIALAWIRERQRRVWLGNALLAVFAVLHVILVWRLVNFRWAG